MIDLRLRLQTLLGTRYDERPFFEFIRDLREIPTGSDFSDSLSFNFPRVTFDFFSEGFFSLRFHFGVIDKITLYVNNNLIRAGEGRPFTDLPSGIERSDTAETVDQKLGLNPVSSNVHYRTYLQNSFQLTFEFDDAGTISQMSIECLRSN